MRLIDADMLIIKVMQVKYFRKLQAKSVIDSIPTVDAVPVIRCKDCKFYVELPLKDRCRKHRHDTDAFSFCTWAERKRDKE